MKIIVSTNQKGGVGKTTVVAHLAYYIRDRRPEAKTLFIDLDPQANSSKTLGEYATGVMTSALFSEEWTAPEPSDNPIDLIQADPAMADLERQDTKIIGRFATALQELASRYDYCLIDTPPTLGLRMTAALVVADFVVAPIELEEYSIDGIVQMLKTIYGVKQKANPKLDFIGMLPNRFNSRSTEQKQTFSSLSGEYSHLLVPTPIGFRTAIPKALNQSIPVWALNTTAGRDAAKEVGRAMEHIMNRVEA